MAPRSIAGGSVLAAALPATSPLLVLGAAGLSPTAAGWEGPAAAPGGVASFAPATSGSCRCFTAMPNLMERCWLQGVLSPATIAAWCCPSPAPALPSCAAGSQPAATTADSRAPAACSAPRSSWQVVWMGMMRCTCCRRCCSPLSISASRAAATCRTSAAAAASLLLALPPSAASWAASLRATTPRQAILMAARLPPAAALPACPPPPDSVHCCR